MHRPPPALIVGMSETGLSTLRLLGQAGVWCAAVDAIEPLPAFRSRYCRLSTRLEPDATDQQIIDAILAIARSLKGAPVLIPTSDRMVLLVSRARETLQKSCRMLMPAHSTIEDVLDKSRFADRMLGLPIRSPRTLTIRHIHDAGRAARQLGFPLILKPYTQDAIVGTNFPKALLLRSAQELSDAQRRHDSCDALRLVAQEYVPGDDRHCYSVGACLDDQGRVRASFTARKRRQGTNGTGVGLYMERVDDGPAQAAALDLLKELKLVGLAEVELKRHSETGELYVIEINARVWLQVTLAAACGINFPLLFYCLAASLEAGRICVKPGAAAWQDLCHDAYATFKPGGYRHKRKVTAMQWLWQSLRATTGPYFSWRDPLPGIIWAGNVLRKFIAPKQRAEVLSAPSPARPIQLDSAPPADKFSCPTGSSV